MVKLCSKETFCLFPRWVFVLLRGFLKAQLDPFTGSLHVTDINNALWSSNRCRSIYLALFSYRSSNWCNASDLPRVPRGRGGVLDAAACMLGDGLTRPCLHAHVCELFIWLSYTNSHQDEKPKWLERKNPSLSCNQTEEVCLTNTNSVFGCICVCVCLYPLHSLPL